jgi:hypothetical protein
MERELWPIISRLITRLDRQHHQGQCRHSVGRIVRVYLWAALHDRPVYWACNRRNWAGVRPPVHLPDQSTMSRRLRQPNTQEMIDQLIQHLAQDASGALLYYLDGKPLPVAKHSCDRDATIGRGAGGFQKGYKLHAIYAENNRPIACHVAPMNVDERVVAKQMIEQTELGEGYLLADANYETNPLYDQTAGAGRVLVTPRRFRNAKGLGQSRQHSPHRIAMLARMKEPRSFVRDLLQLRKRVETRFAHLTNFGAGLTHLPPWVRRLHRVRLYVNAKLIIRLAKDRLREQNIA